MWEAFGRRLRRNYLWIFLILFVSWIAKSYLFPQPALTLQEFVQRGAIGPIPGFIVLTLGIIYHGFLLLIAIGTLGMTKASGEILPRYGTGSEHEETSTEVGKAGIHAWFAPAHKRKQLLALIITNKAEAVSQRIITDLKRGATAMSARGMYTGQERSVLLCALTITEVHNLKTAVAKEDPQAFVIVSPAQEILGRGFNSLEEK
jgi:hypothetical protein